MTRFALFLIPVLLLAMPDAADAKSKKKKRGLVVEIGAPRESQTSYAPPVAVVDPSAQFKSDARPAFKSEPVSSGSATIMAYKRDPVPIFDAAGSKLRDVPKSAMPKANTAAARVLGAKPGFVSIMLDGSPAWLRLTAVDYVGNLAAPPCEKVAVKLAMMEEDGVERSLGLGCAKGK
jgi:hypothetical protein